MRALGVLALAGVTGLLASCESAPPPGCVPGMAISCACSDGRAGAQTCTAERTFAPCECTTGSDGGGSDGGGSDGGGSDGGGSDGGGSDGGFSVDASSLDAASSDDSGALDASAEDSGPLDAGSDAPSSGGHVASFPVDQARILVSDATGDLYPRGEFTVELWVNFDRIVPTLTQLILQSDGGARIGTLSLMIRESDSLACIVRDGASSILSAELASVSAALTAGVWHHLACTGDGAGRIALFVDGTEVARAADPTGAGYLLPGAGQPLALGSGPDTPPPTTWRFNGRMDEFRISNRRMYVADFTPSRRLTLEASTVALYHFDEGAGASAIDEVGPGRHPAMLDMGATWAPE